MWGSSLKYEQNTYYTLPRYSLCFLYATYIFKWYVCVRKQSRQLGVVGIFLAQPASLAPPSRLLIVRRIRGLSKYHPLFVKVPTGLECTPRRISECGLDISHPHILVGANAKSRRKLAERAAGCSKVIEFTYSGRIRILLCGVVCVWDR